MKGRFIPKNPEKYIGNAKNVLFRSSWELHIMKFFDSNPAIVKWSSEELAIPYINPIAVAAGQIKISRYFPDFIVWYKDNTGNIKQEIIEIKPYRETILVPGANEREKLTYTVNIAKWKAAEDFAKKHGIKFKILTEKSIFRQGRRK